MNCDGYFKEADGSLSFSDKNAILNYYAALAGKAGKIK